MKKITHKFLLCALTVGSTLQASAQVFDDNPEHGDFRGGHGGGRDHGDREGRWGRGRLADALDWLRDAREEAHLGNFYRVESILDRVDRVLFRYDRDLDIRRAQREVEDLRRALRYRRGEEFGLRFRIRNGLDRIAEAIRCSDAFRFDWPDRPIDPTPDPRPYPPRGEFRQVLCESFEGTPREMNKCDVGGRIIRIESVRQISRDFCSYNRSYFIEGTQIVVNRGCRAWFNVEIESRGPGGGYPYPRPGDGRDPGHGGGRGPRN